MNGFPYPNVVDLIAVLFIIFSIYHGSRRGLSGEIAQLVSVVVAFVVGMLGHRPVADWIDLNTRIHGSAAAALSFVTIVVIAGIVMICLRSLLRKIMKVVFEEPFDKVAGSVAGFVRSALFTLIVFIAVNLTPHEYLNRLFGEESVIGTLTLKMMPMLQEELEERREAIEGDMRDGKSANAQRPTSNVQRPG
jgi:uncharacterized membrane protein required for colicin V production